MQGAKSMVGRSSPMLVRGASVGFSTITECQ